MRGWRWPTLIEVPLEGGGEIIVGVYQVGRGLCGLGNGGELVADSGQTLQGVLESAKLATEVVTPLRCDSHLIRSGISLG